MKTEKEIKDYLEKAEAAYKDARKFGHSYLRAVGAGAINALRWVLELGPYDCFK